MNALTKQYVINGQTVHLKFYRMGSLWYETESGFMFEVPIEDTGNGIFNSTEKAINLMKWINKQLDKNAKAKSEMGA